MFASPLPVHLEPCWLLQKPRLGPDEFVPATGFTPLSSFAAAQARDNPILVALHHRMRYANVFINEARARRLGLQEGDLVEVWMEEHPDEKQQAFLSVSKVIHSRRALQLPRFGQGSAENDRKAAVRQEKRPQPQPFRQAPVVPRGVRAYTAGHRLKDKEGGVMRYLNLYDSLSCLNCLACMSACSVENRMRLERDAG